MVLSDECLKLYIYFYAFTYSLLFSATSFVLLLSLGFIKSTIKMCVKVTVV